MYRARVASRLLALRPLRVAAARAVASVARAAPPRMVTAPCRAPARRKASSTLFPAAPKHNTGQFIREMDPKAYAERSDRVFEAVQDALEREGASDVECEVADGVLTVRSARQGTWVVNKHSASKQIWLSSPVSGPRKFFFDERRSRWVDERDETLFLAALLREELGALVAAREFDFASEF